MMKFPGIVISILTVLCIGSAILFTVVLTTTRHIDFGALKAISFFRITHSVGSANAHENTVRIPERLRSLDVASPADSLRENIDSIKSPAGPVSGAKDIPPFAKKYRCNDKIDSDDMILLISGKNLFCKKSPWSKPWNNPGGNGIRLITDGLLFGDSVVIDSLTNVMWQRFSNVPSISYRQVENAINKLNKARWQGFDDWRPPTIEEIMTLLVPKRNRHGLYLSKVWNCNVKDIWSCNPACDSLSVQWIWVARLGQGRCNFGHPGIPRALLAVREMK
jgi:hypothetical protein